MSLRVFKSFLLLLDLFCLVAKNSFNFHHLKKNLYIPHEYAYLNNTYKYISAFQKECKLLEELS